jgi:hypothetical protein
MHNPAYDRVPTEHLARGAGVIAMAAVAVILSRTTGLPTDTEDIGNWNCALGIAALSTETLVVLLAAWRMQPRRSRRAAAF